MAFLAVGALFGLFQQDAIAIELEALLLIGEIALVLTLFSDSSRINLRDLRGNAQIPTRLLGLALPLTILVGTAAAPWPKSVRTGSSQPLGSTIHLKLNV